jgi:N-acetylglutamate synthase-like GNAT family acetyltransferase
VFLLTTTAVPLIARLGFRRIERSEAPATIASTTEFSSLCPASAAIMRRDGGA